MASLGTLGTASTSTSGWRYDVFLSFCGQDTRKNFTDHLYVALKHKGMIVYRDDESLQQGRYISEELLKAIQESEFAVVVISENYAFSKWCLMELTEIMECTRKTRLTVLPVFYHVNPSDVRKRKGSFAKAFAMHVENPEVDKKQRKMWKSALKGVGSLAGWHIENRYESEVVGKICKTIFVGLHRNLSEFSKNLVGMKSRVKSMMNLLCIGCDDVRFLGISGMGGIGKTTLAKVIYERFSVEFEASCFIENVREESRNLVCLQKQLVYEILNEETKIWNTYGGIRLIANRFRNRKVIIVVDDVDDEAQLDALVGSRDWFGLGSRILITSRDKHLLKKYVDWTHEVTELCDSDALRLFCLKAFRKHYPKINYVEVSKDIVNYAKGLPLALEVFGSFLFGRKMDAWKSARDFLRAIPNAKILDRLKISFDALEDLQRELFLDIALFFNGKIYGSQIIDILASCGYYPKINIEVLKDKSLVKILEDGRIWIHDLLVKMGQQIVCQESPNEPGEQSRLWCREDIIHVLKNNTGTEVVQGIVLKLPLQKQEQLSFEAFSKMNKLRLLEIGLKHHIDDSHTLEWQGDPSKFMLSNRLCVVKWCGYPLESLPISFQSDNLVELIMPQSYIKLLWVGRRSFDRLKRIDLYGSQSLIETPNFSGVPNLEELDLSYCAKLSKVDSSIKFLRVLRQLSLQGCKMLERLPSKINLPFLKFLSLSNCSRLKKFPKIVVPSLTYLDLHGCSRLKKLPDIASNMTSLWGLDLSCTAIEKLPPSFKSLSSLEDLDISGCSRFEEVPESVSGMQCLAEFRANGTPIRQLPSSIIVSEKLRVLDVKGTSKNPISFLLPNSFSSLSSLQELHLCYCNLSDGALLDGLGCLSSLKYLDLSGNKFTRIPECVYHIPNLCSLSLNNCSNLQALVKPPPLPLRSLQVLNLSYCSLLDGAIFNDVSCLFSSLERLTLSGNKFTRISDDIVQLSKLSHLFLKDCSELQALPKLPLSLECLFLENCPLLETFYSQKGGRTSSEMLLTTDCSPGVIYFGHDRKSYKTLHLHPKNHVWTESDRKYIHNEVVWGPTRESQIPGWFNQRNTSILGRIQSRIDLDFDDNLEDYWWWGYALFIVYEVHEPKSCQRKRKRRNPHEHANSNPSFPEFVCELQVNEDGPRFPLVLSVPEAPPVGPNGVWVFVNALCFMSMEEDADTWSRLGVSISTNNLNVEVKECGARLARRDGVSECFQILGRISPHGFDSETLRDVFYAKPTEVSGPIKGNVKS